MAEPFAIQQKESMACTLGERRPQITPLLQMTTTHGIVPDLEEQSID